MRLSYPIKPLASILRDQLKNLFSTIGILYFTIICIGGSLFAQNLSAFEYGQIDSLNNRAWDSLNTNLEVFFKLGVDALKKSKDTNYLFGKCESYQIMGTYHYIKDNLDSAKYYYEIALEHRISYADSALISGSYNNLGNVEEKKGNLFQAIAEYENALKVLPESEPYKRARLFSNLSVCYKNLGRFQEALFFLDNANTIYQNQSLKSSEIGNCILNEGGLYEKMNELEKAEEKYFEALEIYQSNNDRLNTAKANNNLGNINLRNGNFQNAMTFYNKSFSEYSAIGSLAGVAGVEFNIGLVHKSLGEYEDANLFFDKSLKKWKELGSEPKVAEVAINKAIVLITQKEIRLAEKLLIFAEKLDFKNAQLHFDLASSLARLYEEKGEFEKVLIYSQRLLELKDSLYTQRINWKYTESEINDRNNKILILQKEKKILKEKTDKQRLIRLGLIISLLLSVLLIMSLIKSKKIQLNKRQVEFQLKLKKRELSETLKTQEIKSIRKALDAQDLERARIAKDLHDRLGSMLSMVKLHFKNVEYSLQSLNKSKNDYTKANNLLDQACNEVREIAHNLASGILTNFGLIAAIEELKNTLENTGLFEVELITFNFEERVRHRVEIIIYRSMQELISNIVRHSKSSEITIQLIKKSHSIFVEVSDNGIGFSHEKNGYNGLGLKNIRSRLSEVNGTLTIDSNPGKGTTTIIEIPYVKI